MPNALCGRGVALRCEESLPCNVSKQHLCLYFSQIYAQQTGFACQLKRKRKVLRCVFAFAEHLLKVSHDREILTDRWRRRRLARADRTCRTPSCARGGAPQPSPSRTRSYLQTDVMQSCHDNEPKILTGSRSRTVVESPETYPR